MPVPPAAAVTVQAAEELVKRCVREEVSALRNTLEELEQDHKKALEDKSSLRRTVGKLEQELAKLREDNGAFRQALRAMAERVNSRDSGGDLTCERQLLGPPSLSPSWTLACSSSSSCAETNVSPHLPSSPVGASVINSTPPPRAPSNHNILPDIALQPVDPKTESKIFSVTQHKCGPRRPDEYAANMFMMIVDFSTYLSWTLKVNWNGSDGKQGLPRNVIIRLKQLLVHRFQDLSDREWKDVRDRVNERLRNPRKVDPRERERQRRFLPSTGY